MDKELEILKLADYSEEIKYKDASCYLIVNKNLKEHQCMFGFTNLPDNFTTVKKLYEKVEKRARELGYQEIIGPMNYDTWMSYRWATNSYNTKYYPDCNNPKYYRLQVRTSCRRKSLYQSQRNFRHFHQRLQRCLSILWNTIQVFRTYLPNMD